MKWCILFLFSFYSQLSLSASCCVANTNVSNLMILPANWQQTFALSQTQVIGDVGQDGKSVFRQRRNKEITQIARFDLAFAPSRSYQLGISTNYQNKVRQFNDVQAEDSGPGDLGLFHAYAPLRNDRLWLFQSLNLPTSRSVYEGRSTYAVDAHGTGSYQTSLGILKIKNFKKWDMIIQSEVHYSFKRNIENEDNDLKLGDSWGGSVGVGGGFIPWRSRTRYGVMISPRYEGERELAMLNSLEKKKKSQESLLWDFNLNYSYSLNANYAFGVIYNDQTILGPVKNTLLGRTIGFQFQTRWF